MKKRYTVVKFLAAVLLVLPCRALHAQNYNGLEGEWIISADVLGGTQLSATENAIYGCWMPNSGLAARVYYPIWEPPSPGDEIATVCPKLVAKEDGTVDTSKTEIIVLVGSGDVYKLHIGKITVPSGEKIVVERSWLLGRINGRTSETFQKAVGDALYVLSSSYLYVSKDSAIWNVDSAGLNKAVISDVCLDINQEVYIATNKGLFKQDTAMHAFEQMAGYTGPQTTYTIFHGRGSRMFVATSGGIYTSNNNGGTWQLDSTGQGSESPHQFVEDDAGNIYFTTVHHIYKSSGSTQPWYAIDAPIYNTSVTAPVISCLTQDSTLLFAGTSFGVFISDDLGKTWVQNNSGIVSENISGFAKTTTGGLVASNRMGIYKKDNGSTGWNKIYPASGFITNLPLYDDAAGNIYTVNYSVKVADTLGLLLKSGDGGANWAPDTVGLSSVGGSVFFVDENGNEHIGNSLYGPLCRVWVKQKNGVWAMDTTGFPVAAYSFVHGMVSDKKGHIYATGNFSGNKVMRRPVNGGAWVTDTAGIPATVFYFDRFTAGHGDVVGATSKLLFHRGSGTWGAIPLPAAAAGEFFPIRAVSIDSSGYIYLDISVVKGSGVYFTADLGATWKFCGLDNADVSAMVAYGDTTYVLSRNAGLFALTHQSALPVTMSAIKAYGVGKGVQVEWSGYNETNMAGYNVERSVNGSQFSTLASVAANANNVAENRYQWFDALPLNGDNFYRIKAVSKDGTAQYSGIVKVNMGNAVSGMQVYPNPVKNNAINIQLSNIPAGTYALAVYNAAGQKLYVRTMSYAGGSAALAIDARRMAKGVYWVVLKGNGHEFKKAVVVQ